MSKMDLVTFAGGCFWCTVQPFDTQSEIMKVISVIPAGLLKTQRMNRFGPKQPAM